MFELSVISHIWNPRTRAAEAGGWFPFHPSLGYRVTLSQKKLKQQNPLLSQLDKQIPFSPSVTFWNQTFYV